MAGRKEGCSWCSVTVRDETGGFGLEERIDAEGVQLTYLVAWAPGHVFSINDSWLFPWPSQLVWFQ